VSREERGGKGEEDGGRPDGPGRGKRKRSRRRTKGRSPDHREKEHVMKNRLLIAAGIVVIIIGAVFALQGFGVIEGSAMSNNHTFEVVGPLVALAGLALTALGLRHRGSASQ
jgi:hypothetical protein